MAKTNKARFDLVIRISGKNKRELTLPTDNTDSVASVLSEIKDAPKGSTAQLYLAGDFGVLVEFRKSAKGWGLSHADEAAVRDFAPQAHKGAIAA